MIKDETVTALQVFVSVFTGETGVANLKRPLALAQGLIGDTESSDLAHRAHGQIRARTHRSREGVRIYERANKTTRKSNRQATPATHRFSQNHERQI
ncbi:MAG TPA: hypothetical protein VJ810_19265 [Blastocatellia bacterium]|nr:hypothetical protein [Blastocatellia bacterium]